MAVKCKRCGKRPDEIDEYIVAAEDWEVTPEEYVQQQEGTYNPETGAFLCTECYVEIGMPLGTA